MESIDTKSMSKYLKDSKKHFVDSNFPHDNSTLTRGAFDGGEIQWARASSIIDNAVYSK